MKKSITICILFLCLSLNAQIAGPYLPLKFDNSIPVWNHVPIDSSFIDYEDSTSIRLNLSYDGRSHLFFRNQNLPPTFEDENMYLTHTAFINFDAGGAFVEKIDLSTGETVWKTHFDIRTTRERDYPRLSKIIDDRLVVFAYRNLKKDSNLPIPFLWLGGHEAKLIRKEFDKNTGKLLDEFISDENELINQIFASKDRFLDYDVKTEKLKYYTKRTGFTERISTNQNGQFLYLDTLKGVVFNLNWQNIAPSNQRTAKILESNEELFILDAFVPDTITAQENRAAAISKYDNEGTLVFSKIISPSVIDSFGQLFIQSVTDDFIILHGYRSSFAFYDMFFLILNKNGDFVEKINARHNGKLINTLRVCAPNHRNQKLLFFEQGYDENTQLGFINVFGKDDSNNLKLLKKITSIEERYVMLPNFAWYLDDGDILFSVSHRYIDDNGDYLGFFSNWMRFDPKELGVEAVSIKETIDENQLTVYPNPTSDWLTISKTEKTREFKTVYIYDVLGILVHREDFDGYKLRFNISHLESGVYFCSLTDEFSRNNYMTQIIKD